MIGSRRFSPLGPFYFPKREDSLRYCSVLCPSVMCTLHLSVFVMLADLLTAHPRATSSFAQYSRFAVAELCSSLLVSSSLCNWRERVGVHDVSDGSPVCQVEIGVTREISRELCDSRYTQHSERSRNDRGIGFRSLVQEKILQARPLLEVFF